VSARVAGGIVLLEGQVTSETQHQRVVKLAGQVPGVRGVVDHLTVAH
jgi:osmotically-inducible protein OsmY